MTPALLQLAQTSKPGASGDTRSVLIWVLVLIVLVMGLFVAIMVVRRRLLDKDSSSSNPQTFMEDLRQMRDRGDISPEEFEAAKKTMVARLRGGTPPARPPRGAGPGGAEPSG